ncbi:hypothetical protein ACGFZQ_27550 [Streptomyces sp. NPDC048254]|uniref:hypothetical protein n=1 Tax=Streptomyces sp. NPDC048254 TaxID=3365525 RepID=UPI0037246A97
MKRPSLPLATIALVGVSAIGGGAATYCEEAEFVEPAIILPIVAITAIVLAALRQFAIRQEARVRDLFQDLTRQHGEREQALVRREKAAQSQAAVADLRIRSAQASMDRLISDRARDLSELEELRANYSRLVDDYNEIVLERGDPLEGRPVPRSVAVGQVPSGQLNGPRRQARCPGPHPSLAVVDAVREHQDS